jgi:hypothetical protein
MANFLVVTEKGNVELRSEKGMKLKVFYAGGDAQRADWISEKEEKIQVQTTTGKIKIINKYGQCVRTI